MTDISEYLDTYVSHYTVTFVDSTSGGSLGSGTLARYGNIFGVVTCGHNLAEFEARENDVKDFEIGFLLYPVRKQRQSRRIPRSLTVEIRRYCPGSNPRRNWRGPDIGFLRLPIAFARDIETIASFVNLKDQLANWQKPPPASYVDVVAGNVQEISSKPLTKAPKEPVTMDMGGFLNVGRTNRRSPLRGEDRFYFRPDLAPPLHLPESYEGTSGGGHWRIGFKLSADGTAACFDRRLIGVVYFHTRQDRLIGHGARSIYEHLVPAMEREWKEDCPA